MELADTVAVTCFMDDIFSQFGIFGSALVVEGFSGFGGNSVVSVVLKVTYEKVK
jgi:hypothetical protein